jgi:tight adherence protein C
MLFLVVAITFIAALVVVMSLAYGLSSGSSNTVGRLVRLWGPRQEEEEEQKFRERQNRKAEEILGGIGNLLPAPSGASKSRLERMLVRAGYRRPQALVAFRGAKLLTIAVAVGGTYLSGLFGERPYLMIFALIFGFMAPDVWLSSKVRKRQHRLRLSMPDALDLLVICVEAGLGLDQAILRVSQELQHVHPELSEEMRLVNLEMRLGKTRIEALRSLSTRTGVDDIKALVAMLVQTERFGTSVAQSLRVHSDTLRIKRRQRAEEQAAKAPVKMVPVLVFFIFPALLVTILGPAVIALARQLMGGGFRG